MRLFATEDTKQIDKFYQAGDWGKIVQTFAKKSLGEMNDIRILNDLAVAYHQLSKLDKAYEVCERITAIEPWPNLHKQQADLTPRYMRYHSIMGEVLYRRDKFDEALEIFNRLKVVGSRFSDKYYYSGRIQTKKGNYCLALLEFKGMIANIPDRMRDVIRELGELIKASPAQAGVYQLLHTACQHKDRMEHYLSRFKKEYAQSKGSISAALTVAHLHYHEGDKAAAQKILESLQPKNDEQKGMARIDSRRLGA